VGILKFKNFQYSHLFLAEQLNHWLINARAMDLLHIDCALECELETKTWMFLQTRLQLLLKIFPTSLADDIETISKNAKSGANKLGRIRHMLIQYRILEKTMLNDALEFAKSRVKA
jgi:protein-histidine N-methyltransferase